MRDGRRASRDGPQSGRAPGRAPRFARSARSKRARAGALRASRIPRYGAAAQLLHGTSGGCAGDERRALILRLALTIQFELTFSHQTRFVVESASAMGSVNFTVTHLKGGFPEME